MAPTRARKPKDDIARVKESNRQNQSLSPSRINRNEQVDSSNIFDDTGKISYIFTYI
jgi:hypothetical protein